MAQFTSMESLSSNYSTIQSNGSSLPPEPILNFISSQITIADDPSNDRTNITFPDFLKLSGGTMLGNLILNADPTVALQAATKQYVDSLSAGLSVRTSCLVGSTGALTVTYANGASGVGATLTNAGVQAALSIDGVSLSVGNRVLIKDQASQLQNGIYTVTTVGSGATNWVLTRATDYDTSSEVFAGTYTIITTGTVNATNMYVMTQTGTITIGTTAVVFSAFNSAANINVTAPLTKTGNTIALTTPLAANFGGTGVANADNITLGGALTTSSSFSTSGANALTLTTTGATNVTLPTTGTLVNSAVTTLSSLASIGTITTGQWQSTPIGATWGGTGTNNGSNTLTLGGSLVTSGAFASTFTMTGVTGVTFPTTGTLATTAQLPAPAALTKTDDTNVTLTLGGTPSTALLQATSITAGWTGTLSLARGGTGANLTASNGGIHYSTASATAILAGTATAGQLLTSGASTTPAWSTTTYPLTNAVNTLLYASSANTMAALATANNSVLVTSAGGVPSLSTTLPTAVQVGVNSLNSGTGAAAGTYWSGAGTWTSPTGFVKQRVSTTTGAVANGSTIAPFDDTILQNTEADQYFTLAITPTSSSSVLVIEAWAHSSINTTICHGVMGLFQDSTANALNVDAVWYPLAGACIRNSIVHIMTAGTTSSTTFKIRIGPSAANTLTLNGTSSARDFGGVFLSGMQITEYAS